MNLQHQMLEDEWEETKAVEIAMKVMAVVV